MRIIPSTGNLNLAEKGDTTLTSQNILWSDAAYLGDILSRIPTSYLRQLGEPGLPHSFSLGGIDWQGIGIFLDGRPLNDPVSGVFNLFDVPLESLSQIEFIPSTRSFLYGKNTVAGGLNLVTHQYSNQGPITKIRFIQGPYEHLLTDGLFAQNIVEGLNLSFGFQRQVADGRFTNAKYDSWQLRTRIRYNLSEKFNFLVTYQFLDSRNGMNGGVYADNTRSIYEEASATVVSPKAYQRMIRNDMTFSMIGRVFDDSTSLSVLDIHYTNTERDYKNPDRTFPLPLDQYSARTIGVQFRQTLNTQHYEGLIRTHLERNTINPIAGFEVSEKTYFSIAGKVDITSFQGITPGLFAKYESEGTQSSFGADVTVTPLPWIHFYGGFSRSSRFPSYLESHWPSTLPQIQVPTRAIEQHEVFEGRATIDVHNDATFSIIVSRRNVFDAFIIRSVVGSDLRYPDAVLDISPRLMIQNYAFSGKISLWKFSITTLISFAEINDDGKRKSSIPKLSGNGEIIFQDIFFRGNLHARLGMRFFFAARHDGRLFFPALLLYGENSRSSIPAHSTIDIFGAFRVGDVFFSLTLGNVLDKQYYVVPTYPLLGRHLKIGVNWFFWD